MAGTELAGEDPDIQCWCHDENDPLWGWYWTLHVGGVRINGGLCASWLDGYHRAKESLARHRRDSWNDEYYWDTETRLWWRKGELPPLPE